MILLFLNNILQYSDTSSFFRSCSPPPKLASVLRPWTRY